MRVSFMTLFVLLSLFAFAGCSSNDSADMAGPVSVGIDQVDSPDEIDDAWEEEAPGEDINDQDDVEDTEDEWLDDEGDEDSENTSNVEVEEDDDLGLN